MFVSGVYVPFTRDHVVLVRIREKHLVQPTSFVILSLIIIFEKK